MVYYKICPHCGAHLDPGEKCDCVRSADFGGAIRVSGRIMVVVDKLDQWLDGVNVDSLT